MTVSEKHRQAAREINLTLPYDVVQERIAAALAAAEREGMRRAAEIAEDIEVQKPAWAEIASRQFDAGVCCAQTSIAEAILSEIGEA